MIVSSILTDAAALLNDSSQTTWDSNTLFPYFKKAYKEIIRALEINGAAVLKEVSALTTVLANATSITTITDIRVPLTLWERASGSSDVFARMAELAWEPEIEKTSELRFWAWREATIVFPGATTDRQVKLNYIKTLDAPSATNSTIIIPEAEIFLTARTAALAAALSGGNMERASALSQDADIAKFEFLTLQVQTTQGLPVRKKGYRA